MAFIIVPSQIELTHYSCQIDTIERETSCGSIPDCPNDSIQKDGAKISKEQSIWHKISSIQNNGGQQIEEEYSWCQGEGGNVVCCPYNATEEKTKDNQQSTFWNHTSDFVGQVENCEETQKQ